MKDNVTKEKKEIIKNLVVILMSIQLESIGTRGYIELCPVKDIKKIIIC